MTSSFAIELAEREKERERERERESARAEVGCLKVVPHGTPSGPGPGPPDSIKCRWGSGRTVVGVVVIIAVLLLLVALLTRVVCYGGALIQHVG